jgi:hypothetical protein
MQASRSEPDPQRREEDSAASGGHRRSAAKRLKTPSQAASTRYYFNIRSDRALIPDTKGRALPDLAAALREALALAQASIEEGKHIGQDRRSWRVKILDQAHEHVMTLVFAEAYQCEWPKGCQED